MDSTHLPGDAARRLNARQHRFVMALVGGATATAAAREAGYSTKTAGRQGCDLLKNRKVRAALDEVREAVAERNRIAVDKVPQEAWRVGKAKITDVCAWKADGEVVVKTPEELGEDTTAAIQSITNEVTRDAYGRVTHKLTVRMHLKVPALATILKVLAPTKKQLEVTGVGGGPVEVLTLAKVHAIIEERERIGLHVAEFNTEPSGLPCSCGRCTTP